VGRPSVDRRPSGSRSWTTTGRIVAAVFGNGLMLFDLRDGSRKVLSSNINKGLAAGGSGRVGVALACDGAAAVRKGGKDDLAALPPLCHTLATLGTAESPGQRENAVLTRVS
jgi:hypothetical protein